jgi:hypothetical protein
MADEATVVFHPLEILNVPLPDAYTRYWKRLALYQRHEHCHEIVAI